VPACPWGRPAAPRGSACGGARVAGQAEGTLPAGAYSVWPGRARVRHGALPQRPSRPHARTAPAGRSLAPTQTGTPQNGPAAGAAAAPPRPSVRSVSSASSTAAAIRTGPRTAPPGQPPQSAAAPSDRSQKGLGPALHRGAPAARGPCSARPSQGRTAVPRSSPSRLPQPHSTQGPPLGPKPTLPCTGSRPPIQPCGPTPRLGAVPPPAGRNNPSCLAAPRRCAA
jgi:hypothetical protein